MVTLIAETRETRRVRNEKRKHSENDNVHTFVTLVDKTTNNRVFFTNDQFVSGVHLVGKCVRGMDVRRCGEQVGQRVNRFAVVFLQVFFFDRIYIIGMGITSAGKN